MKNLLEYLIQKISGAQPGEDFSVDEITEQDKTNLNVSAKKDLVGLIIGKEGKTIKNIRKIVAVKAVLENKSVNISVLEQLN